MRVDGLVESKATFYFWPQLGKQESRGKWRKPPDALSDDHASAYETNTKPRSPWGNVGKAAEHQPGIHGYVLCRANRYRSQVAGCPGFGRRDRGAPELWALLLPALKGQG